jgi:hypothetical protein
LRILDDQHDAVTDFDCQPSLGKRNAKLHRVPVLIIATIGNIR